MPPDGRAVVYVSPRGATTHLLMRTLNGGAARALPGTVGAASPFFSPDGRWVAFFADGKLKKVSDHRRRPVVVCDARHRTRRKLGRRSDSIVFAPTTGSAVPSGRGGRRAGAGHDARSFAGEFSHRWPHLLPDGRTPCSSRSAPSGAGTTPSWSRSRLVAENVTWRSARRHAIRNTRASGHLAYAQHGGAIMGRGIRCASIASRPVLAGPGPRQRRCTSVDGVAAVCSVSRGGDRCTSPERNPAVPSDDHGRPVGKRCAARGVAPRVLVAALVAERAYTGHDDCGDSTDDVWTYDITAGAPTQLTFDVNDTAPDLDGTTGDRVAFSSNAQRRTANIFWMPADCDGAEPNA